MKSNKTLAKIKTNFSYANLRKVSNFSGAKESVRKKIEIDYPKFKFPKKNLPAKVLNFPTTMLRFGNKSWILVDTV